MAVILLAMNIARKIGLRAWHFNRIPRIGGGNHTGNFALTRDTRRI
ncbi:MAG TPA: hypothetical protein PLH11_03050 [Gemmobacter sp.]|nr:hypothetical protein [Gemmobacter sp.]